MLKYSWLLIPFIILAWACSPKIESRFLSFDEMGIAPTSFEAVEPSTRSTIPRLCKSALNYAPDTNYISHFPKQQIRINIHWMNSADSSQNLRESEAETYIEGLVHASNYALTNNKQMWLPHGNNTPVLPNNFEYVLTGDPDDPSDNGIYYHYDDSLYYYVHVKQKDANLYSRAAFNKYGRQKDTVLNLFFHPHPRDSVVSPTYKAQTVGVALRNFAKLAGEWSKAYESNPKSFWQFRGTINHEVGHLLGISHSWAYNDGCDDTPLHPGNCWNRSQSARCDTMTTNNVMDYGSLQLAFTPCQLGRIHMNFADSKKRSRRFLVENWCQLNPEADITITDTIVWQCMKDLHGNLTIAEGGHLTVQCRLSIPPNGKITVKTGGTLIVDGCQIHQDCGKTWQGIIVEKQGNTEGTVLLTGDYSIEDVEYRE